MPRSSAAGRVLLSGVTFDARPGDLIALRGSSGSGKTTILRAIAGLDPLRRRDNTGWGRATPWEPTRRSSDAPSATAQRWTRVSVPLPLRAHVGTAERLPGSDARPGPVRSRCRPARDASCCAPWRGCASQRVAARALGRRSPEGCDRACAGGRSAGLAHG